ncbi:MAG: SxtJ family membrane protein [Gemmatimonadales bacterium]
MSPDRLRRFGLLVGLTFCAIGGVWFWRGHPRAALGAGILGAALVFGGLLVPGRLGPVYRAWMRLATLISKVTTPVFMGVVYFLVIAPAGLLRRTLGSNSLRRRPTEDSGFWVRHQRRDRDGMERQF